MAGWLWSTHLVPGECTSTMPLAPQHVCNLPSLHLMLAAALLPASWPQAACPTPPPSVSGCCTGVVSPRPAQKCGSCCWGCTPLGRPARSGRPRRRGGGCATR